MIFLDNPAFASGHVVGRAGHTPLRLRRNFEQADTQLSQTCFNHMRHFQSYAARRETSSLLSTISLSRKASLRHCRIPSATRGILRAALCVN